MKMTKRIVALLLAIAMMGCFFAGCEDKKTEDPTGSPATETPANTPDDSTPTPPVNPETPTPPVETGDTENQQYTFEFKNFNVDDMTCSVGAIVINRDVVEDNKDIKEIVIPDTYMGYKVTKVMWDFMGQPKAGGGLGFALDRGSWDLTCKVKKVVFPAYLEELEYGLFSFYGDLEEIEFKDVTQLKVYGQNALDDTMWFKKQIEGKDFYDINNILVYMKPQKEIVIPSNIVAIAPRIWQTVEEADREEVEKIVINDGCKTVGANIANKLVNLARIDVPASVTSMGNPGVSDKEKTVVALAAGIDPAVEKAVFENGCKYWVADRQYTFMINKGGKTRTIERTVDGKKVKVPQVTGITVTVNRDLCPEENENREITELIIPAQICGYEVITLPYDFLGDPKWGGSRGMTYKDDDDFEYEIYVEKVVIPSTVTTVAYGAFFFNSGRIMNVEFEGGCGLKTVESYAFSGTTWIKDQADSTDNGCVVLNGILAYADPEMGDIVIPGEAKKMMSRLFVNSGRDNGALTSITFSEGVEEINSSLLEGVDNVEWVQLPKSVKKIANDLAESDVTIKVYKGSYADKWAYMNGKAVEYIAE